LEVESTLNRAEVPPGLFFLLTILVMHDDHLAVRVYIYLVRQWFRIPEDLSTIASGDTMD